MTTIDFSSQFCLVCESAPSFVDAEDSIDTRLYCRDDLKELGLIGCGRFAKVALVQSSSTGHVFALKSVLKAKILERKMVQSVAAEKMILKTTCSPFIVRLVATFNSANYLDYLLEPALGGDLFTTYERNENFFGSASHARFYVACVLRGLDHLHERYIIYRDLKMENIMLNNSGYAKLVDFGLSKFVVGHTYTKCGTPDFMAPEMISGVGHTSAADWWALGVLAYSFMEGSLPFDSSQSSVIFWKVQCGIENVRFSDPSASWADLVRNLCKQEPRDRLPVRMGGAKGLCEHPWFAESNFDWPSFDRQELLAPYIPLLKGPTDQQHFDVSAEDMPTSTSPYVDPGNGWDADFEERLGPACLP
mmetsp:Transcript_110408/g.200721  ORF Transcript_110408/g.200721 Transcript_110408/m.200721 type:complete len:362 (+) Transcript_110408:2-1087(+)